MQVLLLELPRLLRGILEHAIRAESGCEVVRPARAGTPPTGPQVPPDFVILGITDIDDTTLVPALFARWPAARVMTLMPAGDDAAVYQLRLDRRTLATVSPEEIVQVLRENLGPGPAPTTD